MADTLKNFAYSTVATAPSPATSGTSLVVAAGQGALFPAVPFNATIWPSGSQPTSANAEIVRVTAISTDTLTITRAQETGAGGPSARTVIVGDQIAATVTAKMVDDRLPLSAGTGYPVTGVLDLQNELRMLGPRPYVDVMSPGLTRKCSASLTSTTGAISASSTSLVVASATGWTIGMGIFVVLNSGVIHTSYVTTIVGTTFTLNDAAPTLASAGNLVGHDDTLAMADAIAIVNALGGGEVFIPAGNYFIRNLTLYSNVKVRGAGASTVLFSVPGNTSVGMVLLQSTAAVETTLSDLVLNGFRSATPAPTCSGIAYANTGLTYHRHTVENVRVTNMASYGVYLVNILNSRFHNLIIEASGLHNLVEDNACFFNKYSNHENTLAGLNGIVLSGAGASFTNTFVTSAGQVDFSLYGDNIYIGPGSHGHEFNGGWSTDAKRICIHVDSTTYGAMAFRMATHQINAAEHLRITSGSQIRMSITAVIGVSQLATSMLNMVAGTGCEIDILYAPTVLAPMAKPVIGAGRLDPSNRIRCANGNLHQQILPGNQLIVYDRLVIPAGGRYFIDANKDALSAAVLKIILS